MQQDEAGTADGRAARSCVEPLVTSHHHKCLRLIVFKIPRHSVLDALTGMAVIVRGLVVD